MSADIYDIFYYCSLIISVITGGHFYKRLETPFRWITILVVVTLISELIAKYVAFGLLQSNSIVYHVFTPIEYTLYVLIITNFLQHKKVNYILWASVTGLVAFEILNTILYQSLSVTNTNTMIAESTLLVILALILFLKIRSTPTQEDIIHRGIFWFASAVLCYYAFNILIWGFHCMKVYLLDNPPQIMYDVNMLLSGLLYLTYAWAIRVNANNNTTKTQIDGTA